METLAKVQEAVKNFDFTAEQSPKGINVYNKKGTLAATIINGKIEQKYMGSRNLCGSLVRDAIKAAL